MSTEPLLSGKRTFSKWKLRRKIKSVNELFKINPSVVKIEQIKLEQALLCG
jgi:hypothetical protein